MEKQRVDDLLSQIKMSSYKAVRKSAKKQKKETGGVDQDIVCEDMWHDEEFVEALDALARKNLELVASAVDEEVSQEQREAAREAENRNRRNAAARIDTRRGLTRAGAQFFHQ